MQPTQPLQRALKRLALTTKQGPHNFYKGNRTGAQGWHTKHGGYIPDMSKMRTYVCPSLEDFKLTPFVSKTVKAYASEKFTDVPEKAKKVTGQSYLTMWKSHGGEPVLSRESW